MKHTDREFTKYTDQSYSVARQIQAAWSPIEAKLMSRQKAKLVSIRNHKAKACYVRDHLTNNAELREACNRFVDTYDKLMDKAA